jgi:hypothetical protein
MSFGSPHVGQISGIVLKAYQISQGYIKITIEVSGILWYASVTKRDFNGRFLCISKEGY